MFVCKIQSQVTKCSSLLLLFNAGLLNGTIYYCKYMGKKIGNCQIEWMLCLNVYCRYLKLEMVESFCIAVHSTMFYKYTSVN